MCYYITVKRKETNKEREEKDMRTIKKNSFIMEMLEDARTHLQLAMGDSISKFDFLDMADAEINLAFRKATIKKGFSMGDALDEIYEYTGWMSIYKDNKCADYIHKVNDFKRSLKY